MKKPNISVDGFIPAGRRPERVGNKPGADAPRRVGRPVAIDGMQPRRTPVTPQHFQRPQQLQRPFPEDNDIQASLREIDNQPQRPVRPEPDKKEQKRLKAEKKLEKLNKKREKKNKKPLSFEQFKKRRLIRRIVLIILIPLLIFLGFQAWRLYNNLSRVVGGDIFGLFTKTRLKQDDNGRTNVLIFGTSPDGWEGADLADSIMVLSYHQDNKDAYTVSLPRDLYVKHTCQSWLKTTAGKLNESYGCGKQDAKDSGKDQAASEQAGQAEIAKAAQEVLGMEIHYKVHANWRVLTEVVNALGGIDVKVEAYDGSSMVYDVATKIRYRNGETVHMNGEQALAFSRARGSAGGIGLSGGNFDRERNQQKIIKAIVEKAKTSNKADFNVMMGILDALGNNINTNFETKEMQTIIDILKEFNAEKIVSIPLVDEKNKVQLLTTSNIAGASVVVPTAGTYNYTAIKNYVKKRISPTAEMNEEARLVILNGSGVAGVAAAEQTKLTKQELNVVQVGNYPGGVQAKHTIYDLSNGTKPKTIEKLKQTYGTNVVTTIPPTISKYNADIVIVLGTENQR